MNYEDSKYEMMLHHLILTDIVKKYSVNGYGEGNVFTYNGKDSEDFMHIKMKNLFNIAQQLEGDVLEIGFNSGFSTLLMLESLERENSTFSLISATTTNSFLSSLSSLVSSSQSLSTVVKLSALPLLQQNRI